MCKPFTYVNGNYLVLFREGELFQQFIHWRLDEQHLPGVCRTIYTDGRSDTIEYVPAFVS